MNNHDYSSESASQRSRPFSTVSLSSRSRARNPELEEPLTGNANNNNDNDNNENHDLDRNHNATTTTTTATTTTNNAHHHDEDDPFYVFREDLYRKLDLVDDALAEYLTLIHQTDTAVNTHAMKDIKKQLKRHLRNAESTLKDVQMTISLVERQRSKFIHISASELYDRQALVSSSNERLNTVKTEMNSDIVKQKLLQDERNKLQRRQQQQQRNGNRNNNNNDDDDDDMDIENAAFMADSQAQTSLLMEAQDEALDELGEAVLRVGQMADHISEEIGLQNRMLQTMEEDLSDAEEKLGLVMGKLAKFLKTKNKWQLGTILILTMIVLLLFFLVLTT